MRSIINFALLVLRGREKSKLLGNGCSIAVEHTPLDKEAVGSNPAGCWAFPHHITISASSLIWSLMEGQRY